MKILPLLPLAVLLAGTLRSSPPAQPPPPDQERNSGMVVYPGANPGEIMLSWWGYDENFYFIETSSDLHEWTLLPAIELGGDEPITLGFDFSAARLFWRLRYSDDPESELLSADLDGDGLSVYREYDLGSDPFNPDTSGDGVFDGIALKLGLSLSPPEPPEPDPGDTTAPAITLRSPAGAAVLP